MTRPAQSWEGADTARRLLSFLFDEPGRIVELRALGRENEKQVMSGYFDNADAMLIAAARLDASGCARGIYAVMNPPDPTVFARSANRMTMWAKSTTSDNLITSRRWLLIDFDPERPVKGVSATDEEKEAARLVMEGVKAELTGRGWPEPIVGDSGNGWHLDYRIDLPSDDEHLVQHVLETAAFYHSTRTVTVDVKNFNPARIWKLYGTKAAKGDSIPGRPHRRSCIVSAPEHLEVVPRAALESYTLMLPVTPSPRAPLNGSARHDGQPFDIAGALARSGLEIAKEGDWGDGGYKWIFAVCPWCPEHTDDSAYVLRMKSGALVARCHHNGCRDKQWHDLRDILEPGWREKRSDDRHPPSRPPPELEPVDAQPHEEREPGEDDDAPRPPPFDFVPFLKQAAVEQPPMLVDGLLLQGSRAVLSGAPKTAKKTWFNLQLGLCLATGMDFLGHRVLRPGRVMFYSGEEPRWSIQARLRALCSYFGVTDPETPLLVANDDVPRIRLNNFNHVRDLCATAKAWGATAIILDPFRRLHDCNENDSSEIAPLLDALTDVTRETGAAVILSHHVGKNKEVAGGAAMRGSSDIHSWYDLGMACTSKEGSEEVHIEVESRHASSSYLDVALKKEDEYAPGRFRRMWLERVSRADAIPDDRITNLRPKIINVVEKGLGSPVSRNHVWERVGGRKETVLDVIRVLIASGVLMEANGGIVVVPGTSS